MQVARKIAPCERALIHVCLAYLFLHSGQVLSSLKCYFKRKYLNLIDSNFDVDESCPWFFIGTVLATGPECIINIYVILGRRNLFEMGAVRSARDQWRSQPADIWSCKCKFFYVYKPYKEPISKEMNNDNHLNLHFHDQMSGWLRYLLRSVALVWRLGILVMRAPGFVHMGNSTFFSAPVPLNLFSNFFNFNVLTNLLCWGRTLST